MVEQSQCKALALCPGAEHPWPESRGRKLPSKKVSRLSVHILKGLPFILVLSQRSFTCFYQTRSKETTRRQDAPNYKQE
jgi:hypothetical protein